MGRRGYLIRKSGRQEIQIGDFKFQSGAMGALAGGTPAFPGFAT
jgi:hypothetical protein